MRRHPLRPAPTLGATLALLPLLAAIPTVATAQGAPARTITSVEVSPNAALHTLDVAVRTDGDATFSAYKLSSPPRLFVDVSNVQLAAGSVAPGTALVQVEEVTDDQQQLVRIIVRLDPTSTYDVNPRGKTVQIGVQRIETGQAVAADDGSARRLEMARQALLQKERNLRDAESRLGNLEKELDALRSRAASTADLDTARARIAALEKQLDDRSRALESTNASFADLGKRHEQAQSRSKVLQGELEDARKKLETVDASARTARSREEDLQTRLQRLEASSRELEAQKRELEQRNGTIGKHINDLATRSNDPEAKKELTAAIEELRKQLDQTRAGFDKAQAERREREREAREQRERLTRLTTDKDQAEQRATALEGELGGLRDELSRARAELKTLQSSHTQSARLQSEVDGQKTHVRSLRSEVDRQSGQITELEGALKDARALLARREQELKDLERESHKNRTDAREAQTRLEALERDLKQARAAAPHGDDSAANARAEALERDLAQTRQRVADLDRTRAELDAQKRERERLEHDLAASRLRDEDAHRELDRVRLEMERLRTQNAQAHQQLQNAQARIDKLETPAAPTPAAAQAPPAAHHPAPPKARPEPAPPKAAPEPQATPQPAHQPLAEARDDAFCAGKPDGPVTLYHPNFHKKAEGQCKSGHRTGTWSTWTPEGRLVESAAFDAR